MDTNQLPDVDDDGSNMERWTAEGLHALVEALKVCKKLRTLRYAPSCLECTVLKLPNAPAAE